MINKEEIEDISEYIELLENEYTAELNERYYYEEEYKIYRDRVRELEHEINKLEKEKKDIYWQGYIKKQNESVEICKICKYKEKYRQKEIELAEANNTINQYKEREQKLIKYLEKEIDTMGSGSSMYLVKLSLKAVLEMMKGEKNEC